MKVRIGIRVTAAPVPVRCQCYLPDSAEPTGRHLLGAVSPLVLFTTNVLQLEEVGVCAVFLESKLWARPECARPS